jgi:hypothetical protein
MLLIASIRQYTHRFKVDNQAGGVVASAAYTGAIGMTILCVYLLASDIVLPRKLVLLTASSLLATPIITLYNRRCVYFFKDRFVKGIHLWSNYVLFARTLRFVEIEHLATDFDLHSSGFSRMSCYRVSIWPLNRFYGFFLRNRRDALEVEDLLVSLLPEEVIDPYTLSDVRKRRALSGLRGSSREDNGS